MSQELSIRDAKYSPSALDFKDIEDFNNDGEHNRRMALNTGKNTQIPATTQEPAVQILDPNEIISMEEKINRKFNFIKYSEYVMLCK